MRLDELLAIAPVLALTLRLLPCFPSGPPGFGACQFKTRRQFLAKKKGRDGERRKKWSTKILVRGDKLGGPIARPAGAGQKNKKGKKEKQKGEGKGKGKGKKRDKDKATTEMSKSARRRVRRKVTPLS
jgi:hypothetical protein